MNEMHACPCCGKKTLEALGDYEICPVCDWEDDPAQSDDRDDDLGANKMSLNQYQDVWKKKTVVKA